MAVPCVTDTCSVTGTIGSDRRLSLSVRLDPTGGLVCGTDANENSGLRVAIYDDPGTAGALTDACLNGLRLTAAGELLSVSPRAGLKTVGGTAVDIPHNGDESANSVNFTAENPYDCTVLGVVFGRSEIIYSVPLAGPFNADIRSRVLRDGTAEAAVYHDIGGDAANVGTDSVKRRYDYFFEVFTAFGGVTTTWTATANHEDSNERDNVNTVGTQSGADLGFRAVVNVLYLPFNVVAVA